MREVTGRWLLPLMLLATLAQNYYDIDAILSGEALALYTYEGPVVLKLGKDLIYIGLLGAALLHAQRLRRSPLRDLSVYVLLAIGLMAVFSAAFNGIAIAAIGLRWALPFALFFLLRDWAANLPTQSVGRWTFAGLFICLAAQVYQLFNMPPVFGEVLPGVPARTPGIFIAPNSAAFFACASAALIMVMWHQRRRPQMLAVGLALLISALAQSGTGLIVATLLALRLMANGRHIGPAFWPIALLAFFLAFLNLNKLTQREDYVQQSGGGRVEVLLHVAERGAGSLANFGVFTNAANLRSENPEDQVAVDSLLASWLGNFGLLALPIALLLFLYSAYRMPDTDWARAMPCLLTFALFSLTSIVFEAFPMNLLLVLGIWAARRERNPQPSAPSSS